jgi:presequence protease
MSISFLCSDIIANPIEGSALSLLSYLLCDTATSPLYKALLESGVAPNYSPSNGFEMHYKEGLFNLGVSGTNLKYYLILLKSTSS